MSLKKKKNRPAEEVEQDIKDHMDKLYSQKKKPFDINKYNKIVAIRIYKKNKINNILILMQYNK